MADDKNRNGQMTRKQLIDLLNEDLAREYQAIIAYVVYSQVLKGAQYMDIAKELEKHAEFMRKHPGMEHDEPYMAHVKPGNTERITWKFTKPGTFHYGCLVAGHFEAGMKGSVIVAARK